MTGGHNPAAEGGRDTPPALLTDSGPLDAADFVGPAPGEIEALAGECAQEKWWGWVDAISWIGTRDLNALASARFWDRQFSAKFGASGGLRARRAIAGRVMPFGSYSACENVLKTWVQEDDGRSAGREQQAGRLAEIRSDHWDGGMIEYNSTIDLVSEKLPLVTWLYDVKVRRSKLIADFAGPREEADEMDENPETPAEGLAVLGHVASLAAPEAAGDQRLAKRARTRLATGYARVDEPFVIRIMEMYDSGKAKSDWDAAVSIMDELPGIGTPDSRARRVVGRVYERRRQKTHDSDENK